MATRATVKFAGKLFFRPNGCGLRPLSEFANTNGKPLSELVNTNGRPLSELANTNGKPLSELVNTNGKPFDTQSLVRKLRTEGFATKDAQAIISVVTDFQNESWKESCDNFASKHIMEKHEIKMESEFSLFKSEVRRDLEFIRTEVRNEIAKISTGYTYDLNDRNECNLSWAQLRASSMEKDKAIQDLKALLVDIEFEVPMYAATIGLSWVLLVLALAYSYF